MLLLRILVFALSAYFIYMIYQWWQENYSPNVTCPQCDGEGVWEVMDGEEECILCKGSGIIEREDEFY